MGPSQSAPSVVSRVAEGVATVTLARPNGNNAWNQAMESEFADVVLTLDRAPDVRVIVITGSGRFFCPGYDLNELRGAVESNGIRAPQLPTMDVGKPLVCAVNGACAGIGLVLALTCDVRFASSDAKFATAFSRRGAVAESSIAWLLPRVAGHANALDLLLSGRTVLAEEALALGLVSRVVAADELAAAAAGYAADVAANCAPRAMRAIKRQVYQSWTTPLSESIAVAHDLLSRPEHMADLDEGAAAFLDQRPPAFAPADVGAHTAVDRS